MKDFTNTDDDMDPLDEVLDEETKIKKSKKGKFKPKKFEYDPKTKTIYVSRNFKDERT